MHTVIKTLTFCYGHRLQGHHGACRRLHGHGVRIEIEIGPRATLAQGMVFDFTVIKERLQRWIDETLDHRMILAHDDPLVPILESGGEELYVTRDPPTAEVLARLIFDQAREFDIPVAAVHFWETPTSVAVYRHLP